MGFLAGNLTRESSTSTGTGAFTLAGAVSAKYTTFNSDIPLGFAVYYKIEHQTLDEWEIGVGELTSSTTLERRHVLKSSAANALVNFSAGTKHVLSDIPAQEAAATMVSAKTILANIPFCGSTTSLGTSLTATGTATASTAASTNMHQASPRVDALVTTASASAVAGFRTPLAPLFLSNQTYQGGFDLEFKWGGATGQATGTKREFAGIRANTAAPTDVNPSTLVSMLGFGFDSADTNMQFMCNDASGTATKVDLGANFVKPTTDRANMYLARLFAFPNQTSRVAWWIKNLQTGDVASGVATADLPAVNSLMCYLGYESVGGTSSVIGFAHGGLWAKAPVPFL